MGAFWGLLTALFIGISDLFGRRAITASSPVTAAALIQLAALVASIVALGVIDSSFDGGDFAIGLASGLGIGIGLAGYYTGLERSTATIVSPIVATLSAVVPFVYALARGSEASTLAVIGAAIAFVGLALTSAGGSDVRAAGDGIRWGLVSGVGYGFGLSIIIDVAEQSGAWPAVAQRVSACALMVAVAVGGRLPVVAPRGARPNATLAGICAGATTVFYLLGVQVDAPSAVVTASLFPAFSVGVGRFFFGDTVRPAQLVGLGVVLVGLIAVVAG